MARSLCHHCGLPVGTLGYESEGKPFCCYGCHLAWRIVGDQAQAGPLAGVIIRFGIAAVLAMNVMMISLLLYSDALANIGDQATHAFRWLLLGLSLPVLAILGVPFSLGAIDNLRRGRISMDALILIGSLAGFGVSAVHVVKGDGHIYFDTATMLLVLVTLGKLLEASARVEASRALRDLVELTPATARIVTGTGEEELPVERVRPGDTVRVRPAERVPVDGIIREGHSAVQEAALTGEFSPRRCGPGDRAFGGSVNVEGEITLEATAVGEAALLGQIERIVRQAQEQRAPAELLADRVAAVFVPLVLLAAAGAFAYWTSRGDGAKGGMAALAVLVVACPCALGLATPLATCVAIGRAARAGILVRSGEALENLSRVSLLLFDKTGTLTEGRPIVREVVCSAVGCSREEALSWLASLESASEHALARSIVGEANGAGIPLGSVTGFRAFPGEGAVGEVTLNGETREVCAGTASFLAQRAIDVSSVQTLPPPAPGDTVVFAAWGGEVTARVTLADALRAEAAAAVREIQHVGISIGMLSGDRREVAEHIARIAGISEVRAGCSPVAKIEEVHRQQAAGRVVAVVGDGINDAPALAEADVGIAMGAGTDLAREVGDITLLRDDLLAIPWLLHLARSAYRVVQQNLAWAFAYNLAAIALAFLGYLHPLIAALAMLGSSLFVIRNSLRLAREAPDRAEAAIAERAL